MNVEPTMYENLQDLIHVGVEEVYYQDENLDNEPAAVKSDLQAFNEYMERQARMTDYL